MTNIETTPTENPALPVRDSAEAHAELWGELRFTDGFVTALSMVLRDIKMHPIQRKQLRKKHDDGAKIVAELRMKCISLSKADG